ncbi:hypothetical protein B0H16DRAFT_1632576 [Mycena metata]|uniref:Transmembrane protein n=1 Tax=Mycena metata TaxID=1033252 RepID=A0AAD7MAY0_9AGAR|nr:hypothetical protein B0H16DRAFT_1632576 [Mycena metata]
MVFPVVVVRLSVVLVALFLTFLYSGPRAFDEEVSSDIVIMNERVLDLSTAASSIIQSLLDDPASFHALVSGLNAYDTHNALIQQRRLRRRLVAKAPKARTTSVLVAANPRSRLGRYLAAHPPSATSPMPSDEYDVVTVTAPRPASRLAPSRLPLPPSATTHTVLVAVGLLAVALVASTASFLKLAQTGKASSSSPSLVSSHTPASLKPVPAAGKPWWARRLTRSNKFAPSLTPIPESLLEFNPDVSLGSRSPRPPAKGCHAPKERLSR